MLGGVLMRVVGFPWLMRALGALCLVCCPLLALLARLDQPDKMPQVQCAVPWPCPARSVGATRADLHPVDAKGAYPLSCNPADPHSLSGQTATPFRPLKPRPGDPRAQRRRRLGGEEHREAECGIPGR